MNCAACRELLPEYALGALEAAESGPIRAHLATGCAGCAAALVEAEATVAQLAMSLPVVSPPVTAKRQLMQRVADGVAKDHASPEPTAAAARATASSRPRERAWWVMPVAWAASVAVSAGSATMIANATNDGRLAAMQSRLDGLAATNDRMLKDMDVAATHTGELTASLAAARETIGMLRSKDLSLVSLTSSGPQPRLARARALWDKETEHWQLIASGMTPPGKGKVFELWFITADQRKVAAGVFDVDADGNGILTVTVPRDIGKISVAAVTDEPGLMIAPTGEIHLAGSL